MYTKNKQFQWDGDKARRNAIKHGVSFREATTAFDDREALIAEDPGHSDMEERHWLIGESALGRVLVVVFCTREDSLRIISARPASHRERMRYEEV